MGRKSWKEILRTVKRCLCDKEYRYRILAAFGFFNFLDDEKYLKVVYYANTGRKLDLLNPKSFNFSSSRNSPPDVKENSGVAFVKFFIHAGIFSVPMSPHCLWCVQPSEIKTLSPSLRLSNLFAPLTKIFKLPL